MFVYFTHGRDSGVNSAELEELAEDAGRGDTGGGGDTIVARLDAATRIREGSEADLWVDGRAIHVFDPASGRNLSLGNAEERAATSTAPAAPAAPAPEEAAPRRQRPTPRHGRTTSPDLVAQPLDDLVAPLVRQDQPVPFGRDPQVGLGLGAVADQVGDRSKRTTG